jgi:hypothetical protein
MYRHDSSWWLYRRDTVWALMVCCVLGGWGLDRWWLIRGREMYVWRVHTLAERFQAGRAGLTLEERGFLLDRKNSRPPNYVVYWK